MLRSRLFVASVLALSSVACASTQDTVTPPTKDSGSDTSVVDTGVSPETGDDTNVDSTTTETSDTGGADTTDTSSSCDPPSKICKGKCVDTSTDPDNCGACSSPCTSTQYCSAGTCTDCTDPKIRCGTTCVDVKSDPANCGTCSKTCAGVEKCVSGTCLDLCEAGTTKCGTTCVSLTSDNNNCGACGVKCPVDAACISASCEKVCSGGMAKCFGVCVDLTTDKNNCAACGKSCGSGGVCTAGTCTCVSGTTTCSGLCVDLTKDPANCGACGTSCGPGGTCVGSVCTSCGSFTKCSGKCVDTKNDKTNCGTCGTTCSGSTPDCYLGGCTKLGVTYTGSFVGGGTPTTQCTDFETFRASISASKTYSTITIKSNLDTTGSSCTGADANTICQALRTGTATTAPCGGKTWRVGTCGSSGSTTGWEVTNSSGICTCDTGWCVRPCIGNNNWGGSNGPTCSAPTQTLIVVCE
jgi:hypothetical protein